MRSHSPRPQTGKQAAAQDLANPSKPAAAVETERPPLPGSYWSSQPADHRSEVLANLRWLLRGKIESEHGLCLVPVASDGHWSEHGEAEVQGAQ